MITTALYCLLSLDTYAHDAARLCAWLLERVQRVGAKWH